MKFLVFQHIDVEHPGIFCDFMQKDGISWDTVELDEGDIIPGLDGYDALIVMGGPMDVWQEVQYSWLIEEKEKIYEAIVERQLPYLGFCLGHQLMADALGGEVAAMIEPEVGILDIEINAEGKDSTLFAGLPNKIKSLQWHRAEVMIAPPGSQILAYSPACAIQALQYGENAFSLQCHVEMTPTTVADWGKIPEYEQSLELTLGPGSLERMDNQVSKEMKNFNASALNIYNNFIDVVKKSKK